MRQLISKLPSNITVPFLGQVLVPVISVKYLGVTFDSNLTFNGHIASLTSSLLSTLVQINRVRSMSSKDVLYIILNSLVFSKLFSVLLNRMVWNLVKKKSINHNLCKTLPAVYLPTQKRLITLHKSYMNLVTSPSKSCYPYVM